MKGADYSWDRPDLNCLWSKGTRFLVRYGSRDQSKNLSKSELNSALAIGFKVAVVWQEGKTQMLRGYSGGQTDARDAIDLFDGLGLFGIPIHFSCDQDYEVCSSADKAKISDYCDGAKSIVGKSRMGGYGDDSFCKAQFDAGRIVYGWQTYAWSEGQWEPRCQLRQVQNNVIVCGGKIDWDESRADDFGQWPRPASAALSEEEEEDMVVIPPGATAEDSPDIGYSFPKFYTSAGFFADVGRMGQDAIVNIRMALHNKNNSWNIKEITLTPSNPKFVVSFSADYDGCSFRRQDNVPIDVIPNFK